MRTSRPGFGALSAVVLLAVLVPGLAAASVTQELATLKRNEATLQKRLDRSLRARNRTENALRLAEDHVARVGIRLVKLKRRERRDQTRLAHLRVQGARLHLRLQTERRILRRQAVAAYMTGRAGSLEILLSQEKSRTVDRMLEYYRYVVDARAREIAKVKATLVEVRGTTAAVAATNRHLARLAAHMTREHARLEKALARRQAVLVRLDRVVQSRHQRLEALQARARRLAALLAGLRRLPHVQPPPPGPAGPFAAFRGRLPLPMHTTYGAIRLKQGSQNMQRWAGVFMPGRPGQTVYAVFPGRVVYANWLRGYGLLLILQNGGGYMTLYGHCRSLLERVGAYVQAGQPIATVGNSGGFKRTGLYFDISHNGRPVDPLVWFAH